MQSNFIEAKLHTDRNSQRVFDTFGSYRPVAIQLLAVPALVPCLLMFLLPRYKTQNAVVLTTNLIEDPHPIEIAL